MIYFCYIYKLYIVIILYIYKMELENNLINIENYENLYLFDLNVNKVLNIKNGKYLKNSISDKGYIFASLYKNKIKNNLLFHRFLFKLYNPTIDIDDLIIDHVNNNKLDNSKNNLRIATKSQYSTKHPIRKDNKSGYKNVQQTKSRNFQVQINKNGEHYVKTFKLLKDAIIYRDFKLKFLYKEFSPEPHEFTKEVLEMIKNYD